MTELQKIEKTGTAAVKKLRIENLKKGMPFMINTKDLPGNQCYLEYPNGSIKLVAISKSAKEFTLIKQLSLSEESTIRNRFNLKKL